MASQRAVRVFSVAQMPVMPDATSCQPLVVPIFETRNGVFHRSALGSEEACLPKKLLSSCPGS